ncbi:MAG TPA: ATP-binding cassette domain-containing protein [Candidatus Nitrosocosmicus sp.]|nr:ATP-binding cassette domain-containing protein [Candidatus Nitrosocosmicus sp.]
MIKFEHITKKFGFGNTGLQDISFEIKDPEFVFLVGPSGAGKTTILRLILRQYIATSGTIIVNEKNILDYKMEHLRRLIGVVFQDFKILYDKNIFENIALSLKVLGASDRRIKDEVTSILHLVGLDDKKFMFPIQLSAGELQRIAIARAIIGDRNIIIADEPTGNLDPKTSWEIMKIFKELESKKTIIIATHNVDIVNSLKKRVITVSNGKIINDQEKGGYSL